MKSPLSTLTPKQRDEVRTQVRSLLEQSEAFANLSPAQRQNLAKDLVTVVGFMADEADQKARGLADPPPPPPTTEDRAATAMKEEMDAIQFPKFVSSLIEGVFQSIVDASMRQMDAYAKLLEAVVKSLDEYTRDHVSPNQARDNLMDKYPGAFQLDTSGDAPKLAVKNEDALAGIQKDLNLPPGFSMDDDKGEAQLVLAAQQDIARQKQQQLSTMVLMGINRIIVTDGLINAKVLIDVKSKDTTTVDRTASSFDSADYHRQTQKDGGWFSGDQDHTQYNHTVTIQSSLQGNTDKEVETHANLSGEVRVNFKSETFPLEKLASPDQLASVNQKAQR